MMASSVNIFILRDVKMKTDSIAVNDLALLELSEEADLNTFTPVCLPSFSEGNQSFTGNATVMGKLLPLVGKIDIVMVRLGLE